jgi:hypothetical protein
VRIIFCSQEHLIDEMKKLMGCKKMLELLLNLFPNGLTDSRFEKLLDSILKGCENVAFLSLIQVVGQTETTIDKLIEKGFDITRIEDGKTNALLAYTDRRFHYKKSKVEYLLRKGVDGTFAKDEIYTERVKYFRDNNDQYWGQLRTQW